MVEGILVGLARFLIGKVLRNLVVEIFLHSEFFFCHHSIFSRNVDLNLVMIWPVFIISHDRVMVNTLELLILFISSDLDLTSGWNIFISESFLDLLALELDLWFLVIVLEGFFLHLFKLHESISIWLQMPNHMLFQQKVISGC